MPAQLAALADAIGRTDAQATRDAAHSIKGVAANMGCTGVRDIAATLEEMGETGALTQASALLHEFTDAFEVVKPEIQRFCSEK
jgi:HPt (histidine-containing phosphotransfer) domain-containing protein